jgi:hypothetical protein
MLRDLGVPVNPGRLVTEEASACAAAGEMGFPMAMKTAEPAIHHKSEVGGVHLGLTDRRAVSAAYRDLSARLGPRVWIAPMVTRAGVEMLLGLVRDAQFGPLVAIGFGGVHVEALNDVVYGLPPFDAGTARRMLDRLRMRSLLYSPRHKPPLAVEEFCGIAARFSAMAAALADVLEEIDLNPVIVHAGGCVAVDALVIGRRDGGAAAGEVRRAI